eukprot:6206976-Pleurochrysis_carterae.AAC.5
MRKNRQLYYARALSSKFGMLRCAFCLLICWHNVALAGNPEVEIDAIVFSKFTGPQSFPNSSVHGLLRLVSSGDLCNFNDRGAEGIIFAFHELRCSLETVCEQLLGSGAVALLRITERDNTGRVGYAYRKFLYHKAAPCVPCLHTAWLGDKYMQNLTSGGVLEAIVHIGTENPWEEMYSS